LLDSINITSLISRSEQDKELRPRNGIRDLKMSKTRGLARNAFKRYMRSRYEVRLGLDNNEVI